MGARGPAGPVPVTALRGAGLLLLRGLLLKQDHGQEDGLYWLPHHTAAHGLLSPHLTGPGSRPHKVAGSRASVSWNS